MSLSRYKVKANPTFYFKNFTQKDIKSSHYIGLKLQIYLFVSLFNDKSICKLPPVYAMKAHKGSSCIGPLILNLQDRRK